MFRIPNRITIFSLIVLLLLSTTVACGRSKQAGQVKSLNHDNSKTNQPLHMEYLQDRKGTVWIPLPQVAKSLGLRHREDNNKFKVGYSDVMFEVEPGNPQAKSFGKTVTLSTPPMTKNGIVYVNENALSTLLNTGVKTDQQKQLLHVDSLNHSNKETDMNQSKDTKLRRYTILSIADNQEELVEYAKKYLGVPYEFGAKPYNESKSFDCSSYTQHVFKKYGTTLPRLARDQSKLGTSVKRSELQVGDLIFFTVPGRFQSDQVAGHVGIYIGDGKFIHTWGEPGVQISPLDSGYWNKVILSMRRIR